MTLVERFIEIDRGPAHRKVILSAGSGVPTVLIMWPIAHVAAVRSGVVDVSLNDLIYLLALAALGIATGVGLLSERREVVSRASVGIFVTLYAGAVTVNCYLVGLWNTPFAAIYIMFLLYLAFTFGARTAIFAAIYVAASLVVLASLQAAGTLSYAPALTQRDVDDLGSLAWAVCMMTPVVGAFVLTFTLSLFTLAARRLQDARLAEAHERLDRSGRLIRRYVPSQLADQIIAGEHPEDFRPERSRLTVFFSDLVGFTDISEELEPEDLARVLNEYFSEMTAIANHHGGTVDELSGDAILIFFGAPVATDDRDHALRAVRMAVEMQEGVARLNQRWRESGITESLRVRIGINTGVVTIGNFGSPDRMKYAVLGKHVNLAARIQALCQPGKVLLSHATWLLVADTVACSPRGESQVKGITRPVATYEVL